MARRDPCSSSLGTVVGPLLSTTLDLAGIRLVNAFPCSSTARRYEQAPIPSSEASENVFIHTSIHGGCSSIQALQYLHLKLSQLRRPLLPCFLKLLSYMVIPVNARLIYFLWNVSALMSIWCLKSHGVKELTYH